MTNAERGAKRRCLTCSSAFFDLNREPIICPSCKEVFHVVELAHSPPRRTFSSGAGWRTPMSESTNDEIELKSEDQDEEEQDENEEVSSEESGNEASLEGSDDENSEDDRIEEIV